MFRWVSGDGAYGDAHEFPEVCGRSREVVLFRGSLRYPCLDGRSCLEGAGSDGKKTRTQKPRLPKPTEESPGAVAASSLEAVIPQADFWQRICLREGDKGPREFEFARRECSKNGTASRDRLPGS